MAVPSGKKTRVTIVGAGFSGLVSAFHLVRSGYPVLLIEKAERAGGLIGTNQTPWGLAEKAANGILYSKEVALLFDECGVTPLFTRKEARARYIYREGKRRWPLGPLESLGLLTRVLPRWVFAKESLRPRAGETVQAWGKRCLGEAATRSLLEPALQGIYAGDFSRLSASLIFGRYFEKKSKSESAGGPSGTVSCSGGMEELIQALEKKLLSHPEVRFEKGREVHSLEELEGDPILLCTPAGQSARLLRNSAPEASRLLSQIHYHPIVAATLCFTRDQNPIAGFGVLFPSNSAFQTLGALSNDDLFERPSEFHSETWILGGARNPEIAKLDETELLERILKEREKAFSMRSRLMGSSIQKWNQAIPHYDLALEATLARIRSREAPIPSRVRLLGNYTGQLGLARILEAASRLPQELQGGEWRTSL